MITSRVVKVAVLSAIGISAGLTVKGLMASVTMTVFSHETLQQMSMIATALFALSLVFVFVSSQEARAVGIISVVGFLPFLKWILEYGVLSFLSMLAFVFAGGILLERKEKSDIVVAIYLLLLTLLLGIGAYWIFTISTSTTRWIVPSVMVFALYLGIVSLLRQEFRK